MRYELIDEYIARVQVYKAQLNLIRVLDGANAPHEKRVQARVESLAQYETLDAIFDQMTLDEARVIDHREGEDHFDLRVDPADLNDCHDFTE